MSYQHSKRIASTRSRRSDLEKSRGYHPREHRSREPVQHRERTPPRHDSRRSPVRDCAPQKQRRFDTQSLEKHHSDRPGFQPHVPVSSAIVTSHPLTPGSSTAPFMTLPPREAFRSEGPFDVLAGTHEMLESSMQKTWPNIFTNLEMVTGPPTLFTPSKLELLGAPSRYTTESSSREVRDEIIQRVDWLHDNLSRWVQTCTKYHHLLQERDRYIHELRRRIVDDGIYISGQEWALTNQRREADAKQKNLRDEIERLNKSHDDQQSRITQLESDLKRSHFNETTMLFRAQVAEKKMEPLAQENERLRQEFVARDQELEGLRKLRDDHIVLQAQYEVERKHNMAVESKLPTMFANFRIWKGSLAWMDDCADSLLAVYDIFINNERKLNAEKELPFDEQAYLLQEFSEDEVAILAPMIASRAEKRKEKTDEEGSSSVA